MTGTFFVLLATFFWALDTLIRYPLLEAGFSAWQIVVTEHLLLVIIVSCWLKITGFRLWRFQKSDWPSLLVIGGIGSALATLAFTQAFTLMNPTLVILLQKLQPIVAVLLSALVLKERLHSGFFVCLLLGISGSLLMMGSDLVALINKEQGWFYSDAVKLQLWAYGLTLFSVLGWGASTVFGKKLSLKGYKTLELMQGRFLVGLLVLLPFAFAGGQWQPMTVPTFGLVLVMVIVSGLLGLVFYYQGLAKLPARFATLAEMAFPVMAALVNWVFLGFKLTPLQILGAVILIAASVLVHLPLFSRSEDALLAEQKVA